MSLARVAPFAVTRLRRADAPAVVELGVLQLDVEAERAHFLDQHVEAFRDARLEGVVAADDRLVDLGAAGDVVRLHRQHLLQRVGGAVGFERPDLHLAEALAAELRLAAQRLLGDEASTGRSNGRGSCRPPGGAASACRCSRPSPGGRTARRCGRRRASTGRTV